MTLFPKTHRILMIFPYMETVFLNLSQSMPPARSLSYLSDVAKLEWALHRNTFAKPAIFFDFFKVSHDKEIYFSLPDKSFLLESSYPIHDIWQMHQIDVTDQTLLLEENKKFYFFIWQSCIEVLQKIEWDILQCVNKRLSLTEIVSLLGEDHAKEKIPALIQKGWLQNYL